MSAWWDNAVVYEIYPRSFQDSDGDGIGDLRGIIARLPYLEWLGVDAIWVAPIFPSPNADFGYDIADHTEVAPELGSLTDLDALIEDAHGRGIRVLLDLVPSHTSIEHPWFRQHPDRYYLTDGPDAPNNWKAAFGGSAWSRDPNSGRLYLHSHFPEQPDLDWRNPETRRAMGEVVRFWLDRGVDGFRVDAVDRMVKDLRLRDDPPATGAWALPSHPDALALDPVHSRNDPEIVTALSFLREAAGDAALFGEVYLPAAQVAPYLEHLNTVFAFDLLHSRWEASEIDAAIERSREVGRLAWVTSNHDVSRTATRWGEENARAAAVLLLCLGGAAVIYQGEELAMVDGPGAEPPFDRFGRDGCRHPMQWDDGHAAGFTTGAPWLGPVDHESRNVASQRADGGSPLNLFRDLIELRRGMCGEPLPITAPPEVLAFARGVHAIVINFGPDPVPVPSAATGEVVLSTAAGGPNDGPDASIAGRAAAIFRRRGRTGSEEGV